MFGNKDQPILHTKASLHDYSDAPYFPKFDVSENIRKSGLIHMTSAHLYAKPVPCEIIDSSLKLQWSNRPSRAYSTNTLEQFNKENDLEFKNIFSLMHLVHLNQQDHGWRPVDPKLVTAILAEYLHNLVFTKWLYQDFVEYQKYVKEQKRKKRQNYQRNLRERTHDNQDGWNNLL